MSRGEWLGLLLAAAATAVLLGAISRYLPWSSPDTPAYLAVPPLPDGWAYPRHPLFGWLVAPLPGRDLALYPPIQTALFLAVTLALHRSLRLYGLSASAAWSVTASLLASNLLLLWHAAVHPEVPAAIAMLGAFALVIGLARGAAFWPGAIGTALLLGLAYILRPSFLPAIVLLPILFAFLARLRGDVRIGRRFAILLVLGALPFLGNSALRWHAVGDFNIVSFGGFQMSGMAGLMLNPDIVAKLPADVRPLGQAILDVRTTAEREGTVIATPLNSRGERSFTSTALGYYDLYARTYDDLLQHRIGALRGDEPWVAFNARLMRLSVATVRAAPGPYLAWVVGGTMRFVGRLLVANLAFVLGGVAWMVLYLLAIWLRRLPGMSVANLQRRHVSYSRSGSRDDEIGGVRSSSLDLPVLFGLALTWTIAAGALTVVTTFPAARYIDTAGLLISALPIFGALTLLRALRRS